jgi:hypothetical protein
MSDAVRAGSRWLHAQPDEDEVREWFEKQSLHDGMTHGSYLGGIVLIGATEKVKLSKRKQNGDTYVAEMERAVFVPYVKVDTRIAYFHDYVRHLSDGEVGKYIGVIEPVPQKIVDEPSSAYFNAHLPEGFGIMPVRNANDSISRFLVATFRVAIIERESPDKPPILQGVGSKQTSLARNWADDNAVMKAETGAIGRALGVAGILVVGTGVATAEDMQEAAAGPSGASASSSEGAVLPSETPSADAGAGAPAEAIESALPPSEDETDETLRERALSLQAELERDHKAEWEAYRAWWQERGFGRLAEMGGPALRGAVVKLERDLDAAKTQRLAEASV